MQGAFPIDEHRASVATRGRGVVAGCALLLALAPSPSLRAQALGPGLDPRLPISQYVHDAWTINEGLPQSTVLAMDQGSDGYLWLATEAGAVRFDGVTFTTYNTANTPGLRDNYVNTLMVDRADTVWVGTWVGGVARLSGDTALPAPGGSGSRVDVLYQDRAGTIWEGRDAGLARWQGGRFIPVPGLDTMVEAIGETADGTLLLGTEKGIRALRQGRVVPWQPPGGRIEGPVWVIYLDPQGGLWLGTPDALYHAAGGRLRRFTKRDGLPAGGVSSILETRRGQIWIGTVGGGIARLAGGRWESFTAGDGLTDNAVNVLLEDREGSLWIGTSLGGLNRLRQPLLTIYTRRQGLSATVTWSVNGDSQGNLWIGTGGGLDVLRAGRVTAISGPGAPRGTVYASIRTTDGDLWAATGSGLARLRRGRWERLGKPFPRSHVSAFLQDASGALWIGGYAGLFRWRDGRLRDFTVEAGLSHVQVTAIVAGRDGALWIGTHGHGLLRLRDGRFTRMISTGGSANDAVEAVSVDEGGVWAGTPAGLDLLRRDSLILLPLASSVLMTDVYRILKDDEGYLWLSSNEGLARVSEQQLLAAASGRGGRAEAEQIVPLDGRGRIEFNGGSQNAGWKSADGRLWFASIEGLVAVDPAHLASNPVPPPVHIERLLVNGRSVEPTARLVLPPGSGTLELHYTATCLLIPERVTFRYRLAGYDDGWVDAGNRRVAYYTHVPGGRYRFQVVAANNDGVWNRQGAVLPFSVEPYFYQTWWFYSLAVLAALAAAYGIFRYRVRRVERAAQQLSELVDRRTGELRQEVVERRRAEERYRHLFDANPQPVWVSDRETLAFLAVNDAAVRHYGYSREEFLGMRLGDLQSPGEGAAFPEWIRAAGEGWQGTGTWHQRTKDGAVIEVEAAARAFSFAGRPAALVVAADVTARRDLEDRLRQAQKMEAVGQLAGGIAHDLNNVLTAVMTRVDLAVAALPSDSAPIGDLAQAQASAHRGAVMIRKLLGFSRRERLVLKPLRLERLTGEVANALRRTLPERLEIVVTAAPELPPVAADAGAVRHILLDLATNARDAMAERGRITLDVRPATAEEVRRAAEDWGARGHYVVLRVSDNGRGMDERTLARVFEPYFSTKAGGHGSGLGLAMVYGLMKQHRGYIRVDSRPGAGTDVRLFFPATADAVPAPAAPVARGAGTGGDRTILVVEDQEEVRSAATRVLTRSGYRVLSASDGEEGLRAWRANAEAIDLVFSDAIMPRMGGLALVQAMRRERPGVRFLLTSGFTGEEVRESGPTATDLPFLAKPWTVDELLAAVQGALQRA